MTDRKLLIGGEWVDGADGGYDVVNPATEEIVGVAPEASPAQALDAARAAQEAFPAWSQTTPEARAELLRRRRRRDQGPLQGPAADRDRRDRLHRDRRQADAGADRVDALRDVRTPRARSHRDPAAAAGDAGHRARARRPDGRDRAPSAGRRGRVHHAVQLPDREHGRQARARARDGQHRCGAARVAEPARGDRPRRHPARGRLPARRRQRRHRLDARDR